MKKSFTLFFRFSSCVWQGTANCTTTSRRFGRHLSLLSAIILQMRWNELNFTAFNVETLLIFLKYTFELLINLAPPLQTASTTRISRENALKTDNSLACPIEIWRWGVVVYETTLHAGGRDSAVQGIFFSFIFSLFGRFVFTFLTIKYLLPIDMFSFIHAYCWPFTASRGVVINVFLV